MEAFFVSTGAVFLGEIGDKTQLLALLLASRFKKPWPVIAGILVLAVAVGLLFIAVDVRGLIRDAATTIAVPVAAWAGIFGAEIMIRRRGFDSDALLHIGRPVWFEKHPAQAEGEDF